MPAVVRVKRRIDEEPLSAFVLNSKRRRVDDNGVANVEASDEANASGLAGNKEELSTLLKFAGTISEQDDSATTQFARLTKEEARELVLRKTRKPVNVTERSRREMRQHLQEQRFRVVNCLRTTLEDYEHNANDNTRSKEITIVDIEKQNTTNDKTVAKKTHTATASGNNASTSAAAAAAAAAASAVSAASISETSLPLASSNMMPSDSDTGYVYDLYIPDTEQTADYVDLLDENYLSVRPFDDLIYEDHYNNDNDDDEYDSEDSNQENYFGNEYPDEDDDPDAILDNFEDNYNDDDDDDEENNLVKGLNKFVFGEDDDDDECESMPSSDDEDEKFYNAYRDPYVHAVDADEVNFCPDVDSCDVDRYGMAYARYKARILKQNKMQTSNGDDDDDDDKENNSSVKDFDESSSNYSCDYDAYYDTVAGED